MLPIPPGRPSSAHHRGQDCKGLELSLDSHDEPRWGFWRGISSCPSPGEPPLVAAKKLPRLSTQCGIQVRGDTETPRHPLSKQNHQLRYTQCLEPRSNEKKNKTLRKHLVCVFFSSYYLVFAIECHCYLHIYIYIIPISGWFAQVKPHIG